MPPDKPDDQPGEARRDLDAEHKARTMAQVQPIIEAAEQAATGILEEAEAQARRQVEEAQERADELADQRAQDMWALTDELINRAEAVKRQADDLLEALEQTRRGVSPSRPAPIPPSPEDEAPDAPRTNGTRLEEVEREEVDVERVEIEITESHSSRSSSSRPSTPLSEGARLLATQMVVAGSSRAEIATRLRDDFGIEDPESMLDAIHGAE